MNQMKQQQKNRDRAGRYENGPACEACGKPAGFSYMSLAEVDSKYHGVGLVLCSRKRCPSHTLPTDQAVYEYIVART